MLLQEIYFSRKQASLHIVAKKTFKLILNRMEPEYSIVPWCKKL